MTIVIGYFGEECFVLAADRKRSRSTLDYSASVAKVFLSEDSQLAIGAAGDYTLSRGLARRLIKIWNEGNWPVSAECFLEEKADSAFAAYYAPSIRERVISEQPRNGLLIFDAKKWQLYELSIFGESSCTAHTGGFIPIGHTENAALFFSERYSGRENAVLRDLSALKLLAVFTVSMAGELNPSGIGNGTDILTCDRERRQVKEVRQEEISALTVQARKLDKQIADLLFQGGANGGSEAARKRPVSDPLA